MTIKAPVYTRRAPWRTVVGPETRKMSLTAMQTAVIVGDIDAIEQDWGRALHTAILRFQEEQHVFVAGLGAFRSYDPMTTNWSVWLYDIELQDEGTENRSVAELERALGAAPNRCRKCGGVVEGGKCTRCGTVDRPMEEGKQ